MNFTILDITSFSLNICLVWFVVFVIKEGFVNRRSYDELKENYEAVYRQYAELYDFVTKDIPQVKIVKPKLPKVNPRLHANPRMRPGSGVAVTNKG